MRQTIDRVSERFNRLNKRMSSKQGQRKQPNTLQNSPESQMDMKYKTKRRPSEYLSPEGEKELTKSQAGDFLDRMGGKDIYKNQGAKYVDVDIVHHLGVDKVQCLCHPMKTSDTLKIHYPKCVGTTYQHANNQRKRYAAQKGQQFNRDKERGESVKYSMKEKTVAQLEYPAKQVEYKRVKAKRPQTASGPWVGK